MTLYFFCVSAIVLLLCIPIVILLCISHFPADKPDPPTEIKMSSCGSRSAELSWKAGASNNAQITEYLVEYNTSYDRDRWIVEEDNKVPGTENSARIDLSPYANYTFRVRASNAIGLSDPSEHTGTVCTTPPARPDVNPKNVCIKNTSPTKLIITWEVRSCLFQISLAIA